MRVQILAARNFDSIAGAAGRAVLTACLVAAAPPVAGAAQSAAELAQEARRADAAYVHIRDRLAPLTAAFGGSGCSERVGRYCLRFDEGATEERPIRPESPRVKAARRTAIAMYRRHAAAEPSSFGTAAALVRLHLEAGNPDSALVELSGYGGAAEETGWGHLLRLLAAHRAGASRRAAASADSALAALPAAQRAAATDLSILLSGDERRLYRALDLAAKEAYEGEFWAVADPLALETGNDRYLEHLGRYAWNRISRMAPRSAADLPRGRDDDEITLRYGMPVARERHLGAAVGEEGLVERFDTAQRFLVEPHLRTGRPPLAPGPGERSRLFEAAARSGYAPVRFRRLLDLEHQATRLPEGDSLRVRIDFRLVADSAGRGALRAGEPIRVGVGMLENGVWRVVGERQIRPWSDSVDARIDVGIRAHARLVSIEAIAPAAGLAWRSRYALEPLAPARLAISDPLLTPPFRGNLPAASAADRHVQGLGSVTIPADSAAGVVLLASGLESDNGRTNYRVRVEVRRSEPRSVAGRAVRWLGRTIGLAEAGGSGILAWTGEGEEGRRETIAFDLDLRGFGPGDYVLEISIEDLVAGRRRNTHRPFRISR